MPTISAVLPLLSLLFISAPLQTASAPAPQMLGTSPLRGTDAASSIQYVMIPLSGKLLNRAAGDPPRLTAQCTQTPDGKQHFELLTDAGDVTTLHYFAPWHQTTDSLFPPRLEHVSVTMEFLGYTRVKPVKRTWDRMDELREELRYATPGINSANMESVATYLQYMRSLPTLHLTFASAAGTPLTLEFATAPWLEAIRKEPLCRASGL